MQQKREEIAVIGGGLAGCLTALMLAKNPRYHVTLIEKQPMLFNGASLIASRLHLGGEYPMDDETQKDCLEHALLWKMLMPDTIYTAAPPMKFLVAKETQEEGATKPDSTQSLTTARYQKEYDGICARYRHFYSRLKKKMGWKDEEAQARLFGPPKQGSFFKDIFPQDLPDYPGIAGGIQTQEPGLNTPKYLAMIEQELEKQQALGNITIRKNTAIAWDGVRGDYKNFTLQLENGETMRADQVFQSASRDGPAIMGRLEKSAEGDDIEMVVYKRAMLLIKKLPHGWQTQPAFIMKGKDGGMLAPYNDQTAICYRPTKEAAYWRGHKVLSRDDVRLPEGWDDLSSEEEKTWKERYLAALKERFPILKDVQAEDTQLLVRDTIAFQRDMLHMRPSQSVSEVEKTSHITMVPVMITQQLQQQGMKIQKRTVTEIKKGLFTIYPTKATYGVGAAVQAAMMAESRSNNPEQITVKAPKMQELLEDHMPTVMKQYSLADMRTPTALVQARFMREHELPPAMLKETWPEIERTRDVPLHPYKKRNTQGPRPDGHVFGPATFFPWFLLCAA